MFWLHVAICSEGCGKLIGHHHGTVTVNFGRGMNETGELPDLNN
jgi:hypothetical protein